MSELISTPTTLPPSRAIENLTNDVQPSNFVEKSTEEKSGYRFKSVEQLTLNTVIPEKGNVNNIGLSGFHLFDSWTKFNNIPARISQITEELIYCECLMDKDTLNFEERAFPKLLFDHISISNGMFILVSIKSKIGSSRVDVYRGDNFFDSSLFDKNPFKIKDKWSEIESSQLDTPFEYIP
jgi:hypothetical protein